MQDIRQIILNETLKNPKYKTIIIDPGTTKIGNKIIYGISDLPNDYYKAILGNDRTVYVFNGRRHRAEIDPKTGLTKWAVKKYDSILKCYSFEWWINGAPKRIDKHPNGVSYPNIEYENGKKMWVNNKSDLDRDEKDPVTGASLPAYTTKEAYIAFCNGFGYHRVDGPAITFDPILYKKRRNHEYDNQADEYYLDNNQMTKEEWEKDPRVQRELGLKVVEDPKTSDDDFLRGFGKIL